MNKHVRIIITIGLVWLHMALGTPFFTHSLDLREA